MTSLWSATATEPQPDRWSPEANSVAPGLLRWLLHLKVDVDVGQPEVHPFGRSLEIGSRVGTLPGDASIFSGATDDLLGPGVWFLARPVDHHLIAVSIEVEAGAVRRRQVLLVRVVLTSAVL